jgi:FkbM family methyltransferase
MAAIGIKSVAVEPFQAHVDIIQGSKDINKHMHIHLVHGGVGENATTVMTKFVHGRGNYGSTMFVPQHGRRLGAVAEDTNQTLEIVTLEDILSVSEGLVPLVKLDCEGCEWEALLSAKTQLAKVQMIKMEVNRPYRWSKYRGMTITQQLQYMVDQGFYLFHEIFPDTRYYFQTVGASDIDRMFGGKKVPESTFDYNMLHKWATTILRQRITPQHYNAKMSPDVIAIRKETYDKMAAYFLV